MLVTLTLPDFNEYRVPAKVEAAYLSGLGLLEPGAKLFDLKVELSSFLAHDCAPVSYFRIALRERVWSRRIRVKTGDELSPGTRLMDFTTIPDESPDGEAVREVRVSVVGILPPMDLWDEQPR